MPRRRKNEEMESEGSEEDANSESDNDSASEEASEDSEEVRARRRRARRNKRGKQETESGVDVEGTKVLKMPIISNSRMKRKIYKKIGYKGVKKEELVPGEIFEYLWKISQNEQN